MLFTKRHYRLFLLQTVFFNNSEMECFIQIIIVTYLANCNSHHIIIISYLHFPCCFIKTRCENAFSHSECTASPKWVRQPFLKKYCKNYQSLTIILLDWWLWLQDTDFVLEKADLYLSKNWVTLARNMCKLYVQVIC